MWKLTYKWAKHSHPNKGKRWITAPVLRRVQPVQAGPVGVRRPRQRRLPPQVRLDEDHPAHPGQGLGVPGRPGPGRLLGARRRRGNPRCAGLAAAAEGTAGRCATLRRTPASRRPGAAAPRRVGTVDHCVRKAVRRQAITIDAVPGHRTSARLPSHPHPLPTPPPRRHRRWTSTSATDRPPSGLARAGCPESGHGRFQGGGGAAMRRRYPTGGSGSRCWRRPGWRCSW